MICTTSYGCICVLCIHVYSITFVYKTRFLYTFYFGCKRVRLTTVYYKSLYGFKVVTTGGGYTRKGIFPSRNLHAYKKQFTKKKVCASSGVVNTLTICARVMYACIRTTDGATPFILYVRIVLFMCYQLIGGPPQER